MFVIASWFNILFKKLKSNKNPFNPFAKLLSLPIYIGIFASLVKSPEEILQEILTNLIMRKVFH